MQLRYSDIKHKEIWEDIGISVPDYNIEEMAGKTGINPKLIHFGAGNIFRGFIAKLQDSLLNEGIDDTGIIVCDTYDPEIIENIYKPYDNLALFVGLKSNGETESAVVGSIADALFIGNDKSLDSSDLLKVYFSEKSLQMVSFTITEKGYSLYDMS